MESDEFHKQINVGITPEYRKAYIWSLVLHAAGIDHLMEHRREGWSLWVAEVDAEHAEREIAVYEEENKNWPPVYGEKEQVLDNQASPPTVLLMGALLLFHQITGPWSSASKWFAAGAVNASKILENNEWWRVVTGLTLHADIVHVAGNIVLGGVLIHFICRMLCSGIGTTLVLLSGILGNTINVVLRGGDHQSVGFSTAVFGAVGILSGLRVRKGNYKQMIAPLGAGFGLLAMLGTEGERTDLGAHLWGLAAGLALGLLVAGKLDRIHKITSVGRQTLFLAGAMGIVLLSWWLALHQ